MSPYYDTNLVKGVKMAVEWIKYIVSSPDVLRGKPRIKKTRIPVSLVLGYLASGYTIEDILLEFPDLTKEHILACLDYARASRIRSGGLDDIKILRGSLYIQKDYSSTPRKGIYRHTSL